MEERYEKKRHGLNGKRGKGKSDDELFENQKKERRALFCRTRAAANRADPPGCNKGVNEFSARCETRMYIHTQY